MRENDEITGLFRSRLAGAEMTVREGFWEKLQEDVASPAASRKKAAFLSPKYYRIAAAASVIFVLGGVSAAFWFFSPKEEIKDAFTQVAALTPEGSLNGDVAQESFPSIHQAAPAGLKPGAQQPASGTPVGMTAQSEEESGSVSVRLSITIRQRVQTGGDYFNNNAALQDGNPYQEADRQVDSAADAFSTVSAEEEQDASSLRKQQSRKWALKAALGTSLPKRNHNMPLTGRVAPHRGVDFAMPQGTPVLSVGDGEVVVAKRSGAAGYYVAIRHGRSYTTRYMHLRKILVKPGQKVKRGDRIALSGNTGRSTGPHLHYEVWINQQAVNPLTAKLPRTEGLTGSDRREFLAQAKEIVPQLRFD